MGELPNQNLEGQKLEFINGMDCKNVLMSTAMMINGEPVPFPVPFSFPIVVGSTDVPPTSNPTPDVLHTPGLAQASTSSGGSGPKRRGTSKVFPLNPETHGFELLVDLPDGRQVR